MVPAFFEGAFPILVKDVIAFDVQDRALVEKPPVATLADFKTFVDGFAKRQVQVRAMEGGGFPRTRFADHQVPGHLVEVASSRDIVSQQFDGVGERFPERQRGGVVPVHGGDGAGFLLPLGDFLLLGRLLFTRGTDDQQKIGGDGEHGENHARHHVRHQRGQQGNQRTDGG